MNTGTFYEQYIMLENERARLTPLKETDCETLDEIAYHPEIWKLGMSNITEQEELQEYINTAITERANHLSYPLLIFDKQRQKVAGSTRLGNISFEHKRLEIGWTWLHPSFQGSGLNKACKFLLLQFAFEMLQFNRVEIKTDVLNMQSRKAILKIGAKEEGIFRKHQVAAGGRVRDSIYFSIVNDEWSLLKTTVFSDLIA